MRVATYNIHKCRGLDGRVRPGRILNVLRELNVDVIALQEVLSIPDLSREANQAAYLAGELEMQLAMGENCKLRGGAYGNVILSRFPIRQTQNYDISVRGRERRGCLRADLELRQGRLAHVFNVHLGTAFIERRRQARSLMTTEVIDHVKRRGPRIVLGDFNEWTRGLASRMLSSHLESADIRYHLRRSKTYPGVFPFLHLDHIYHDAELHIVSLQLHRSRAALVASDHLPLVAEFRWTEG